VNLVFSLANPRANATLLAAVLTAAPDLFVSARSSLVERSAGYVRTIPDTRREAGRDATGLQEGTWLAKGGLTD
jgi:hypothetical protein